MELGVVALLRLAWVVGTLPIVLASLPIPGSRFLHRILTDFASRGKIRKSSSWMFTVPQSYFLHFYVVAVVITTLLVLCVWFYAYSIVAVRLTGGVHVFSIYKSPQTGKDYLCQVWRAVFVLLLMEAQVLRRLYESINVFNYSSSARMHVFGYLTGLFFYTAAPLSLCFSVAPEALSYASDQIAAIIIKGHGAMPDFEFQWWAYASSLSDLGWCQWIGAAGFIWGWCHQLRCHAILGSLREHRGADEYVIPHGDWFDYVSCAHYSAEIVIYASMLIATGGLDITVWFLFVFVVSNLVFAAAETHRWYQQKFDSYPKSRRAILPFIY